MYAWYPSEPSAIGRDCQINDRCYRRLDPDYFAWLRIRMYAVKTAVDAGRVPEAAFDELRQRFNAIQAVAVDLFGEHVLLDAVRRLDAELYRLPLPVEPTRVWALEKAPPSRTPAESERLAVRLARAREMVDRIREEALALGWTTESLYRCDGSSGKLLGARNGLVCYVSENDRIGRVTREWIEILGPPPIEVRSRFQNPDVEHPWVVKNGR